MNIAVSFKRPNPTLINPTSVPLGKVYSWGAKQSHYLRVAGGSVVLGSWQFIPMDALHFGLAGPRVQVADTTELAIGYED